MVLKITTIKIYDIINNPIKKTLRNLYQYFPPLREDIKGMEFQITTMSTTFYYDDDAETLFSVGRRFLTGNGLEKNVAKAIEMLTQAAKMGHQQAKDLLKTIEPANNEEKTSINRSLSKEMQEMLAYNKQFVETKAYEKYVTSKFPDKKIAIVTCMDTRLVKLLPAALGLKNGDVKIIRNAGATITNPFDSTMRSLLVAIYELGVKEIMIIGHTGCGVQGMDSKEMLHMMRERGIDDEHISLMKHCGIDLDSWLHGFDDTEAAILETVDLVKNHPLMPKDITVNGYIMDSTTGELKGI